MKEVIFNLFAFVEQDYIEQVGIFGHKVEVTSDEELEIFLMSKSQEDLKKAKTYQLPDNYKTLDLDEKGEKNAIPFEIYKRNYQGTNEEIGLYEVALAAEKASLQPLVVYNIVKNNQIIESYG
ncbi:MAG: hypothetical protein MJB14_08640 [Spirochaetes bacterium]|nr:hypothetical protein [Spirochaetota bacterium]